MGSRSLLSLILLVSPCPTLQIMNSKQFLVLFFSTCVLNMATGLLSAVTYNSALYLPLLGGASTGGLGTVLAALGALKLGAVALLLASNIKGEAQAAESEASTGY